MPAKAVRATEAQLEAQENVTCPGAPYLPPQVPPPPPHTYTPTEGLPPVHWHPIDMPECHCRASLFSRVPDFLECLPFLALQTSARSAMTIIRILWCASCIHAQVRFITGA